MEYDAKITYRGDQALDYDRSRTSTLLRKVEWDREFTLLREFLSSLTIRNVPVLDAPTGTGRFLPLFAEFGCRAVGLDISHDMLTLASERRAPVRAELVAADCESLPFSDGAFDYVISIRFVGHLPPEIRVKVLKEFRRVSRRGLIVGYPILNFFTAVKFMLGSLWYRLRTGRRRRWWPATTRSVRNELHKAALTILTQRWVLRPWSQIALLHLVPNDSE